MSDFPEHDRMTAITDQSQQLGSFLEWLRMSGIVLARWEHTKPCDAADGPVVDYDHLPEESGQKWRCEGGRMVGHPESNKPGVIGSVCKKCDGTGSVERIEPRLTPTGQRIEQVLADYFGIDLDKIEDEKRSMLAQIRAAS